MTGTRLPAAPASRNAGRPARILLALALFGLAGCSALPDRPDGLRDRPAAPPAPLTGAASPPPGATSPDTARSDDPRRAAPPLPADATPPPVAAERLYGTGRFVRTPASARTVSLSPTGDITLNFVDADLRAFVRAVLGDLLGLNYAVDPAVQGTVTLQTERPIAEDALLDVAEIALGIAGAALVADDALYRIVPREAAPRGAGATAGRQPARGGPGYRVQVVPLAFASAAELADILERLAPAGAVLRVDRARNLLVIGGAHAEIDATLETIAMFDVDWLEGMSFGFFPVRHAEAETLAGELADILDTDEADGLGRLLRLVPVGRLNAIIAITPQPAYLDEAASWIARLDRAGDDGKPRLFVYYVENREATELAAVLNEAFTGATRSAPTRPGRRETGDVAPFRERITLGSTGRDGTPGPLTTLDPAAPEPARPARPVALDLRAPAAAAGTGSATAGGTDLRILADEANNALLVFARPADYRLIEQAIERLDLIPLQVLIEATIAEVTLNDELRFGIEWFFESGDSSVTFSALESGVIGSAFPGFSYLLDAAGARAVINALSAVTDVKVISSPQVMVLDNRTATLQVGDQVPIATQSAVSVDDPDARVVNSIEFFDTGVILEVTPRVNAGGLVVMEIDQEVSDAVRTTTSGIDSPTIQQRRVTSSVAVQSGETVALGGLIRESRSNGTTGIPVLSEIPVLGTLFGVTSDEADRTELLILITPRVVRDRYEARDVTDELRRRLRAVTPLGTRIQ